ncbi:MAG: DsbA family protein [Desulfobacteraceae bacterium]|nr:DsbA family protein [Desulfobacteraceae bacterium]
MAAGPVVRQVLKDFHGQVRLVMKYIASNELSEQAAEAALAAWKQGRYWEMHDKLIESSPRFGREDLLRYAGQIGLDKERFAGDLDGMRHRELIARDMRLADKLGLFATPTFFVNGRMVVGAPPYQDFKAMIEKELAGAGKPRLDAGN